MLTIYTYRTQDPQLRMLTEIEPNCWVDLIDQLPAELNWVSEELSIPIDYLNYPLDSDERARTEKAEGVTLIVLRVPRYEGGTG